MLDSSLHYIVMRRYSERLAKLACKMMNRQLGNFGEHFQSDIFLQMRIYVFAYTIGARGCKAPRFVGGSTESGKCASMPSRGRE